MGGLNGAIDPGREGYAAYENGWGIEDNPYPAGDWPHDEWADGWLRSQRDDE